MQVHPAVGVYVCWLSDGENHNDFTTSLLELQQAWGGLTYTSLTTGPALAEARNDLVRRMPAQCEWMLMLDNDLSFRPSTIAAMFASARPDVAVTGCYTAWDPETETGRPALWLRVDGRWVMADAVGDDPFEVDGAGAGAILVHRQVLDDVAALGDRAYPWFRFTNDGDEPQGEDLTFWSRVAEAGYPITAVPRAWFGHHKRFVAKRRHAPPR